MNRSSITFTPSRSSQTLLVLIIDDDVFEGEEYFSVKLVPLTDDITIISYNSELTVIIQDDDQLCNPTPCHPRANCSIINGMGVSCDCLQPYVGDGYNCRLADPCSPSPCHQNATCTTQEANSSSATTDSGSGLIAPDYSSSGSGSSSGSSSGMEGMDIAVCTCDAPFVGNGTHCDVVDPCDPSPCSESAVCESVMRENGSVDYNCVCKPMFTGDGVTCIIRELDNSGIHIS